MKKECLGFVQKKIPKKSRKENSQRRKTKNKIPKEVFFCGHT